MISDAGKELQNRVREKISPAYTEEITFEELRETVHSLSETSIPEDMIFEQVTLAGVNCDWTTSPKSFENRVIIHFHGGGYSSDKDSIWRSFATTLSLSTESRVLIPNYSRYPEHSVTEAIDDCVNVYRAILGQGIRSDRIIFSGDSLGGGMVLAVLLALKEKDVPLPKAAVCMSPVTDLTRSGESYESRKDDDPWLTPEVMSVVAKQYASNFDPKHPLASPLFADLQGMPPLLIHVGDHEILLDDSVAFAEKAKAAGVDISIKVWEEMWHVFHFFAPALPEANDAFTEIGDFVDLHWA